MAKVSTAKAKANKANAQRSTGPCTSEGKARARWNGLKHGLRAELVIVPTESADAWDEHREAVLDSIAPQNYLESIFAERAALAAWRLRRAARFERALVTSEQHLADDSASRTSYTDYGKKDRAALERARAQQETALRALDLAEGKGPDREIIDADWDDDAWFNNGLLEDVGARCAGIELETYTPEDCPDETSERLPLVVYERSEDYTKPPTVGEVRAALAALWKHNANTTHETETSLRGSIRAGIQYELDQAEYELGKLDAARESAQLPIKADDYGCYHEGALDLLLRYETTAENSLHKSLDGLVRLRRDFAAIGDDEGNG